MVTVIVGVVAPVLQVPPSFPESITLPPAQNVVAPLAEIIDAVGCIPIVAILLCKEIAPAVERPLPRRDELSSKLMAPLAINVPLKTELFPKSNLPFICQYTLHKDAELIKITLEFILVDKAPSTLKIN